jgi:tetraacyldisaccharide 4'-kinase
MAAFCGIARPEQFFAGLEAAGFTLTARIVFQDHHRYTTADLERLVAAARASGATSLMTTEKDRVRLGGLVVGLPQSIDLLTARLRVEIENESEAIDWLAARIAPGHAYPPL